MNDTYINPLSTRYASYAMQHIFSDDFKFITWRKLWIALATAQKELGLAITQEQIQQMQAKVSDIDYAACKRYELQFRHDVMAHIHAYGDQCPLAKPIIHLGATSCYVGDNTDIIVQKEALLLIKKWLVNAIAALHDLAEKHTSLPCLAYTHFQAAQPTTLGKRICLWIQDLLFDVEQLDFTLAGIKLLGCKGTTGTAASFLSLFDDNHEKVKQLEEKITKSLGFDASYPISGQTYSRKIDYFILSVLSGIAQSAYKFSNDIRLLSHLKEVDEPFEKSQIGSSAMAYKRNPMRSERIASLARHVTVSALNPALTASAQWLERTLDDSANRRIAIAEAFLATDAILQLVINVSRGLTVNPHVIKRNLHAELPFMATENVLMRTVKKGGNRQHLHERIRTLSIAAAARLKEGESVDLLADIADDKSFGVTKEELYDMLETENFTGRATEQAETFLQDVKKFLKQNEKLQGAKAEITV